MRLSLDWGNNNLSPYRPCKGFPISIWGCKEWRGSRKVGYR